MHLAATALTLHFVRGPGVLVLTLPSTEFAVTPSFILPRSKQRRAVLRRLTRVSWRC